MRYLTLNEVLEVHRQVMAQSGGAEGLMHLPALESALAQPQMTFGGEIGAPDSPRREALQKSLIGMRLIIEILETLPPGDPFLDRCAAIARRIQASPPAEHVEEVLADLAMCVEIARSKIM